MIEIVKVSSKGQIVIPETARNTIGIRKGSRLVMVQKGGTITLEREEQFMKAVEKAEKLGWLAIAEKALAKDWSNKKDDETWSRYL